MPQGKKNRGGRGNNKKKRGAGHGKNAHRRPNERRAKAATKRDENLPLTPENALEGDVPDVQAFEPNLDSLHESYPSVYSRYKAATNRVFKYMQDSSTEGLHEKGSTVNSLVTAADWMQENNRPVDSSIVKDLKLAIRVRSRVAKSVFGGGDSGHKHLLTTLRYCWSVLSSLPRASIAAKDLEKQAEEKLILSDLGVASSRNHFEALQGEDSDEDTEMEEELFPGKPILRPDPHPEPLSLEEIIKSDFRHDSWLFLDSMDEYMRVVVVQYEAIRKQVASNEQHGTHDTSIVEGLLEAAVATNMVIQQVQRLEMEFENQHPGMATPYHVLTTFAFPETLLKTRETVCDHGQKPCSETEARHFLSDCLEHNFRPPSDPENKRSSIVSEFCQRYELSDEGIEQMQSISRTIEVSVPVEVPMGNERTSNKWMFDKLTKANPNYSSHSWIPRDMPYIGGDRAIHHTIRLLQFFGPIVSQMEDGKELIASNGFFGPRLAPGRSHKIAENMDELLMADILPKWALLCRDGILGKVNLPRQNELATVWVCMKRYFDAPTRPVRWSTAFAVHAMLTAIVETDGVIHKIAPYSKLSFEFFFEQIDRASFMKPIAAEDLETVQRNLAITTFLRNFDRPIFSNLAMWNPLSGGTVLSYLAFFANLEIGCMMINDRSQLRMVLHLYHALVVNNLLDRGEIPLLDTLFNLFQKSSAIWNGMPPTKGRIVEQFWLSMGAEPQYATKMSNEASEGIRKISSNTADQPTLENLSTIASLDEPQIEVSEICTGFRRICNRDFHDVVDNYHTPEQRRLGRGSDYYTLAVQTNDTLDAIDNEQQLLALNLSACGTYLWQIMCDLSAVLQWDLVLDRVSHDSDSGLDRHQRVVYMFAQHLLGALDSALDPMGLKIFNVAQGRAARTTLRKSFGRIRPGDIAWFQAVGDATIKK